MMMRARFVLVALVALCALLAAPALGRRQLGQKGVKGGVDPKYWMSDMYTTLKDKPISQIWMPGELVAQRLINRAKKTPTFPPPAPARRRPSRLSQPSSPPPAPAPPGTHDSGANDLRDQIDRSFDNGCPWLPLDSLGSMARSWGRAQDLQLADQIRAGARYLDLRVAYSPAKVGGCAGAAGLAQGLCAQ